MDFLGVTAPTPRIIMTLVVGNIDMWYMYWINWIYDGKHPNFEDKFHSFEELRNRKLMTCFHNFMFHHEKLLV